jgi:hypothetical protein
MRINIAPDFRDLLPEHTESELAQLEKNVLADPQHKYMPPVVLWQNHEHTIIDGHHQYELRQKHKLKIKYQLRVFNDRQSAIAHALTIQLGRRNLNPSQLAMVAAKIPRIDSRGQPEKNSANLRNTLSAEDRAEIVGVSTRSVESADHVHANCSKPVIEAVSDGIVSVSDADSISDLDKSQQSALLRKCARANSAR